ncbi:unnamed protein product [Amoebophrya sp. A120]|nr:unnamed protein product [Amoebophrya sp. A120]|eukprot:GSA120T00012732001.1
MCGFASRRVLARALYAAVLHWSERGDFVFGFNLLNSHGPNRRRPEEGNKASAARDNNIRVGQKRSASLGSKDSLTSASTVKVKATDEDDIPSYYASGEAATSSVTEVVARADADEPELRAGTRRYTPPRHEDFQNFPNSEEDVEDEAFINLLSSDDEMEAIHGRDTSTPPDRSGTSTWKTTLLPPHEDEIDSNNSHDADSSRSSRPVGAAAKIDRGGGRRPTTSRHARSTSSSRRPSVVLLETEGKMTTSTQRTDDLPNNHQDGGGRTSTLITTKTMNVLCMAVLFTILPCLVFILIMCVDTERISVKETEKLFGTVCPGFEAFTDSTQRFTFADQNTQTTTTKAEEAARHIICSDADGEPLCYALVNFQQGALVALVEDFLDEFGGDGADPDAIDTGMLFDRIDAYLDEGVGTGHGPAAPEMTPAEKEKMKKTFFGRKNPKGRQGAAAAKDQQAAQLVGSIRRSLDKMAAEGKKSGMRVEKSGVLRSEKSGVMHGGLLLPGDQQRGGSRHVNFASSNKTINQTLAPERMNASAASKNSKNSLQINPNIPPGAGGGQIFRITHDEDNERATEGHFGRGEEDEADPLAADDPLAEGEGESTRSLALLSGIDEDHASDGESFTSEIEELIDEAEELPIALALQQEFQGSSREATTPASSGRGTTTPRRDHRRAEGSATKTYGRNSTQEFLLLSASGDPATFPPDGLTPAARGGAHMTDLSAGARERGKANFRRIVRKLIAIQQGDFAQLSWRDVALHGRGALGESILHICLFLNTPAHRVLVHYLVVKLGHRVCWQREFQATTLREKKDDDPNDLEYRKGTEKDEQGHASPEDSGLYGSLHKGKRAGKRKRPPAQPRPEGEQLPGANPLVLAEGEKSGRGRPRIEEGAAEDNNEAQIPTRDLASGQDVGNVKKRAIAYVSAAYTVRAYRGETALHIAIMNDDLLSVELLIDHGADLTAQVTGSFFTGRLYSGALPLSCAAVHASTEMAVLLIARNANPLLGDVYGNTFLHIAVLHGREDHCRSFHEFFPDLFHRSMRSRNGSALTPLALSVCTGQASLFSVLLELDSEIVWSYGPMTCRKIPLLVLDSLLAKQVPNEANFEDFEEVDYNEHDGALVPGSVRTTAASQAVSAAKGQRIGGEDTLTASEDELEVSFSLFKKKKKKTTAAEQQQAGDAKNKVKDNFGGVAVTTAAKSLAPVKDYGGKGKQRDSVVETVLRFRKKPMLSALEILSTLRLSSLCGTPIIVELQMGKWDQYARKLNYAYLFVDLIILFLLVLSLSHVVPAAVSLFTLIGFAVLEISVQMHFRGWKKMIRSYPTSGLVAKFVFSALLTVGYVLELVGGDEENAYKVSTSTYLYAIASIIGMLKFMVYLRPFRLIGPFIVIIEKILVHDFLIFMVIYLVFTIGFLAYFIAVITHGGLTLAGGDNTALGSRGSGSTGQHLDFSNASNGTTAGTSSAAASALVQLQVDEGRGRRISDSNFPRIHPAPFDHLLGGGAPHEDLLGTSSTSDPTTPTPSAHPSLPTGPFEVWHFLFAASLGELSDQIHNAEWPITTLMLYECYVFLSALLAMPLLISMMSDTYSRIRVDARNEWVLERIKTILTVERSALANFLPLSKMRPKHQERTNDLVLSNGRRVENWVLLMQEFNDPYANAAGPVIAEDPITQQPITQPQTQQIQIQNGPDAFSSFNPAAMSMTMNRFTRASTTHVGGAPGAAAKSFRSHKLV